MVLGRCFTARSHRLLHSVGASLTRPRFDGFMFHSILCNQIKVELIRLNSRDPSWSTRGGDEHGSSFARVVRGVAAPRTGKVVRVGTIRSGPGRPFDQQEDAQMRSLLYRPAPAVRGCSLASEWEGKKRPLGS